MTKIEMEIFSSTICSVEKGKKMNYKKQTITKDTAILHYPAQPAAAAVTRSLIGSKTIFFAKQKLFWQWSSDGKNGLTLLVALLIPIPTSCRYLQCK